MADNTTRQLSGRTWLGVVFLLLLTNCLPISSSLELGQSWELVDFLVSSQKDLPSLLYLIWTRYSKIMDSQGRVGLGAVPLPWSLEAQHLTTPCIGYPCVACFCPAPAPPPTPLNQPHWLLNQGQRSDAFLLQQPHTHALGTAFPVVGGYLVEYSPYPLPPGAHGIPIGVWNTTSNSFNVEMVRCSVTTFSWGRLRQS